MLWQKRRINTGFSFESQPEWSLSTSSGIFTPPSSPQSKPAPFSETKHTPARTQNGDFDTTVTRFPGNNIIPPLTPPASHGKLNFSTPSPEVSIESKKTNAMASANRTTLSRSIRACRRYICLSGLPQGIGSDEMMHILKVRILLQPVWRDFG